MMEMEQEADRCRKDETLGSTGRNVRSRPRIARGAVVALLAAVASAAVPTASGNAGSVDAQRLLGQYKCYICHADHEAKAGPAYADVAARFRARRDAVSIIAAEIRRGVRRGGPWHMPPHPEVSVSEARMMARYIMSLDMTSTSTPGAER